MHQNSLVSIIMNCHNGQRYLKYSLKSIFNQTYKNWELIFWDNLSTDGSKKILDQFRDKRVKYYKSKKFISLDTSLSNIGSSKKLIAPFKRTLSRLYELTSPDMKI